MRQSRMLLAVVVTMTMAACGGGDDTTAVTTTPPEATTTTVEVTTTTLSPEEQAAAQLAADLPLLKSFWRASSDIWAQGLEAGVRHDMETAYPGLPNMEYQQCFDLYFPDPDLAKGYYAEYVLDDQSVEPDPDWVEPDLGTKPDGRIYIMTVTLTTAADLFPPESTTSEVHLTVLDDGSVHDFPKPCV